MAVNGLLGRDHAEPRPSTRCVPRDVCKPSPVRRCDAGWWPRWHPRLELTQARHDRRLQGSVVRRWQGTGSTRWHQGRPEQRARPSIRTGTSRGENCLQHCTHRYGTATSRTPCVTRKEDGRSHHLQHRALRHARPVARRRRCVARPGIYDKFRSVPEWSRTWNIPHRRPAPCSAASTRHGDGRPRAARHGRSDRKSLVGGAG